MGIRRALYRSLVVAERTDCPITVCNNCVRSGDDPLSRPLRTRLTPSPAREHRCSVIANALRRTTRSRDLSTGERGRLWGGSTPHHPVRFPGTRHRFPSADGSGRSSGRENVCRKRQLQRVYVTIAQRTHRGPGRSGPPSRPAGCGDDRLANYIPNCVMPAAEAAGLWPDVDLEPSRDCALVRYRGTACGRITVIRTCSIVHKF